MLKKCRKMKSKFLYAFSYIPKVPFEVIMEDEKASNEYCEVLQKSIDDKFDYTIEKYGTKADGHSWEMPDIVID